MFTYWCFFDIPWLATGSNASGCSEFSNRKNNTVREKSMHIGILLSLKSLMSENKANYSNKKVVTSIAACFSYLEQTCYLPLSAQPVLCQSYYILCLVIRVPIKGAFLFFCKCSTVNVSAYCFLFPIISSPKLRWLSRSRGATRGIFVFPPLPPGDPHAFHKFRVRYKEKTTQNI